MTKPRNALPLSDDRYRFSAVAKTACRAYVPLNCSRRPSSTRAPHSTSWAVRATFYALHADTTASMSSSASFTVVGFGCARETMPSHSSKFA